jgi:hypothetical protein
MGRGALIAAGEKGQGQPAPVRDIAGEEFLEALSLDLAERREDCGIDAGLAIRQNMGNYQKEKRRQAKEPRRGFCGSAHGARIRLYAV